MPSRIIAENSNCNQCSLLQELNREDTEKQEEIIECAAILLLLSSTNRKGPERITTNANNITIEGLEKIMKMYERSD